MQIFGSENADIISGTSNSDEIYGLGGNDRIYLSDDAFNVGNDVVYAGDGDDTIYVIGSGHLIYGGEGSDTLDFSYFPAFYGGVYVDLLPQAYSFGQLQTDTNITAFGIENFVGTSSSDRFYGDANDNTVTAGAGDDTIFGRQGNDWLVGGDGDDLIAGGAGLDTIFGGAGRDQFEFFSSNSGYYQGSERDYIVDFELNIDKIAIDFDLANNYDDLLTNASIYQDETSTVIEFNNGTEILILNHFDVNNVNRDMFLFYQI